MIRLGICIYFFCNISACSFNSSQLTYLNEVIGNEQDDVTPEKNWVATWGDHKVDLFAINVANQIIFADKKINIFFKNDQIYKITGLFANNEIVEIFSEDLNLKYSINGSLISTDLCNKKQLLRIKNDYSKLLQVCYDEHTQNEYVNHLIINSNGLLVDLNYRIAPNYPSLELSMK